MIRVRSTVFPKVAIFVASCFIVLFTIEYAYRLTRFKSIHKPPPMFIADSLLGFRYNPNHSHAPGGFRGGPIKNTPGLIRIACVGESVTAGDLLPAQKTWPAYLQYFLDSLVDSQCYVINAAVGGYGSQHVRRQLSQRIASVSPDIVLIYAGLNGRGFHDEKFPPAPFPVVSPIDDAITRLDKWLHTSSAIYMTLIRWRIEPYLMARVNKPEPEIRAHGDLADSIAYDLLFGMDALKRQQIMPILILYPSGELMRIRRLGEAATRRMNQIVARMGEMAERNGFDYIDMRCVFPDTVPERYFFVDDKHLSANGSRFFAAALADSLSRKGFVRHTGTVQTKNDGL